MHVHPTTRRRGAVLLEVILAVVLFAATAGVLASGLQWSVRMVSDMRLEGQAADLAVTVLSLIQIGQIDAVTSGPNAFDWPDDAWTWEVDADSFLEQTIGGLALETVTVRIVVRHVDRPVRHTLTVMISPDALDEPDEGAGPLGETFRGGGRR